MDRAVVYSPAGSGIDPRELGI